MKKNHKKRYQVRRKKTRAEIKASTKQNVEPRIPIRLKGQSSSQSETNYKLDVGSPFYQLKENFDCIMENWQKGIYPLDNVYPTDPRSGCFLFSILTTRGQKENHLINIGCSNMVDTPHQWMLEHFGNQKWHDICSFEVERLLVEDMAFLPTNGTRISKNIWDKKAYTYLLCEGWNIIPEIKKMPMAKKDCCMIDCSRNYLSLEEQKKLFDAVCDELMNKGINYMHFLGISKELQEYYYENPAFDENGVKRKVFFGSRIFLKTKGVEYGVLRIVAKKMEEDLAELAKHLAEHNGEKTTIPENPFFEG